MQKVNDIRSVLRIKNIQSILNILLKEEEVPRVRLSEMTGLTKTTITSLTRLLLEKGIIEELDPTLNEKGVGRTIIPLRIKKDAVYAVGINLSRHSLSAIVMNAKGEIVLNEKGPSYGNVGPKKVIENLFHVLDEIWSGFPASIETIGIGVPGPIDRQKGIVMDPPKFYGWKNVPLAEIVNERYDVPVWIENDANCAALAEKWYGSAKNIHSFLYVLLNEGIGMGIVVNEGIYMGASNFEGELGHFVVTEGKTPFFLENHPCYEHTVQKTASGAEKEQAGELVGYALASISNVLNPQKIFIGGKLVKNGDISFKKLKESFEKCTLCGQWGNTVDIETSKFGEAISIGSAAHAIRKFLIMKVM